MFVVSFPYAILHGGLWALAAIVIVACVCCYTGEILVHCLYDVDFAANGARIRRKRTSYVQIAERVWGKANGARLVNTAQLIGSDSLIGTIILCSNEHDWDENSPIKN